MKSKTIEVNGVQVTCFEDGSIEKLDRRFKGGRTTRTFGSNCRGYKYVRVGGKLFRVHRLIAQAYLPDWNPDLEVDHISGVRDANRPENLRMTEENERCFRSKKADCTSDFIGVNWNKGAKKWLARIKLKSGKRISKYFDDEVEAARWRDVQAVKDGRVQENLNSHKHPELSMLLGAH